jgi:hypothetical protein
MESILTVGKFALTKAMSVLAFGLSGASVCVLPTSESSSYDDRSWHDDYLIGKSDLDTAWYYERRRWRS